MIRWIFFDVGNVIMNDDPVMSFLYAELHGAMRKKGIEKSYSELLDERERTIRASGPGHWYFLGEKYLGVDGLHMLMHECASRIRENYMAYHNILPGIPQILSRLSQDFSMGIVANQLRESVDALGECGLRGYFQVLAISELTGLKKPDSAIFQWALESAKCAPAEAIMVGDRIDNDIFPARSLGMRTIWFHASLEEKGYCPPPNSLARMYFESQKRASIGGIGPSSVDETPDADATSAVQLVSAIDRLRDFSQTMPSLPAKGAEILQIQERLQEPSGVADMKSRRLP